MENKANHQSDAVATPAVDIRPKLTPRRSEEAGTLKFAPSEVDAAALAAALRQQVRGEVRFDDGSRALYATDASNYRQVPIGVVLPRTRTTWSETVAVCRSLGAPILSRGGGTSLAGSTCNAAVVIDFSKYMNRVVEIDPEQQAGASRSPAACSTICALRRSTRHYTFGPDPATHNRNTLGGMIGNNSCGMHAQMAGKVEDNTDELEIAHL